MYVISWLSYQIFVTLSKQVTFDTETWRFLTRAARIADTVWYRLLKLHHKNQTQTVRRPWRRSFQLLWNYSHQSGVWIADSQLTWVTCADTIVPRTGFFYIRFVPRSKIEPVFGTFNIKRTVRFGTTEFH